MSIKLVNEDKLTYKPPYTIVIIDVWDAWLEAFLFDAERYQIIKNRGDFPDLDKAIILADALFIVKNYLFESFEQMTEEGGFDVRIYDTKSSCVYVAHETFKKKWIRAWSDYDRN
ncbi:hypothetical protein A3A49_02100 [Candidatus Curtissbacteria bacterium RIFCSPLOWO2_01_FULL_38_11b]|uniref:Uncharacterized protein n=1 Tax=Candidatus Curtissbacteria bacterium RIFCSPLOWO2_01_FULL_38_11b TaxID=1797725 RepID=A0A1F5H1G2_9BACT|nr:MAG: hypothetical protein A3A49_02100 [Candidatus Curtissbacteria bacterium RIFCSPLOWO2_01_FULL_38_11b]